MMRLRTLSAAALAASLVGAVPAVTHADPTAGVDVQLFRPTMDPNGIFSVEAAEGLPRYDMSFKMGVGYGQTPLTLTMPGIPDPNDDSSDAMLKYTLGVHITAAFAFTKKLSFGFDTGAYRTDTDAGYGTRGLFQSTGVSPSTGLLALRPISNMDPSGSFQDEELSGPFDTRLSLKYAFYKKNKLSAAVIATGTLPFGDEEVLLGDASTVLEPKLALGYRLTDSGTSKVLLNVGARFRKRTALQSYDTNVSSSQTPDDAVVVLDIGSELMAGGGLLYEILPQLIVGAEAMFFVPLPEGASFGSCKLYSGDRCSSLDDADYMEGVSYGDLAGYALGGVNYRASPDVTLTVAGGAGLTGARKDAFRLIGGVAWTPTPSGARVIGRGDRDGDGNPDQTDICPDEPEDKDDYQDDDGCPDLDNDGDGIIDASDACPNEPEDKDGYQDDDGCPEPDNDGDGVPDVVDRCPNDKEDKDNWEDDDGCPDEDNDGDGIADSKDKCPNQAETVNGFDDLDGCPDAGLRGGPQWDPDRIDLQGSRIDFAGPRSSKLTKASRELLDQIATLMLSAPQNSVRVEVHVALSTKSKNKRVIRRAHNNDKRLADRRARTIVDYLTKKGVPASKLRYDALGSSLPLRQPAWDPLNERVDFMRTQ